jgi:hypothetical protein
VIAIGKNLVEPGFAAAFLESSRNMTKFSHDHGPTHTAHSAISPFDCIQNVPNAWLRDMNTLVKLVADDSNLLWALPQKRYE